MRALASPQKKCAMKMKKEKNNYVLRNSGADFLHSWFIDSIWYERCGSVITNMGCVESVEWNTGMEYWNE